MRRLRPQRRRQRSREYTPLPDPALDEPEDQTPDGTPDNIVPFVPVARERDFDQPDDDSLGEAGRALLEPSPRPHRRRLHVGLPRPSLGVEIRFSTLLLSLSLFAGGIFGTLLTQNRLRDDATEWWPLILVIAAVLWMLIALIRRQAESLLGGAALAGIGLSFLMDTQNIADVRETLLGVVLVAVGLGIAIRGLLLRQQTLL
jgi:hypothetical protein